MGETETGLAIVAAVIGYALWKSWQQKPGQYSTHETSKEVAIYDGIAVIGCVSASVGLVVIALFVLAYNIMVYGTAIVPDVPSLKEVTRVYLPIATLLGIAGFLLKHGRENS